MRRASLRKTSWATILELVDSENSVSFVDPQYLQRLDKGNLGLVSFIA